MEFAKNVLIWAGDGPMTLLGGKKNAAHTGAACCSGLARLSSCQTRIGGLYWCRWLLVGDDVVQDVEHRMNVIVAPVIEQIPHGLLLRSVLAHGAAVLLGQRDTGPGRHDIGIPDKPLKYLTRLRDIPVCPVDLRERILLRLLETDTLLLHAGQAIPGII
ncbi:hypothetical protein PQQ51_11670 [Paraburkholderia xenovorans]|uniref:hypothetical protein n=1 Tax=Paraburkholderia xenovorans TaxID=36873 RepID=UPI0038BD89F6